MQRYLSFSGGGFNSHSLLAGMIAGSLDALEKNGRIRDLGLLTRSVDGLSANSGGSWFLSQLSYSQKFLNQFTTSQSASLYNSTGYNGQIADIYQKISTKNESSNGSKFVSKILSNSNSPTTSKVIQSWISLLRNSGLSWRNFNQQITFKPFGMASLML